MLVTPRAPGPWAGVGVPRAERPTARPTPSPIVCAVNYTQPTVKLLHSSCDPSGDTHATVQLLCLISDFTPGDIEVTWLVDGQKAENMFPYTSPPKQEGKLASTSSQLNITQGQWVSQSTYTCKVNYLGTIIEDHARSCPGTAPARQLPRAQGRRGPRAHAAPPAPHRVRAPRREHLPDPAQPPRPVHPQVAQDHLPGGGPGQRGRHEPEMVPGRVRTL